MPELPEVETVRRGLESALPSKRITHIAVMRRDLRVPVPDDFEHRLHAQTCLKILRRGKYIIIECAQDQAIILHLGMSGRIRIYHPGQPYIPIKHDHVILTLDDETKIVFHDPRRFGFIICMPAADWRSKPPFQSMGCEPLEASWTARGLFHTLQSRKKTTIKQALLDQAIVSGLGNIYVCEALFYAGISPLRIAADITGDEASRLKKSVQDVLQKAIEAGGSTLKDYKKTDGSLGYFQYQFAVYGREGQTCITPTCAQKISRIIQGGRSTFYCPCCQN